MGLLLDYVFNRGQQARDIVGKKKGLLQGPTQTGQPLMSQGQGLLGGQINPLQAAQQLYEIGGNTYDKLAGGIQSSGNAQNSARLNEELLRSRPSNAGNTPSSIQEYNFVKGLNPQDRDLYFKNKRAARYLDLSTGFQNTQTNEFVPKDIIGAGVQKATGVDAGKRLTGFQANMNTISDQLSFIEETQGQLAQLSGMTTYGNTGFMSYLNAIPTSDQKAWDNIKTTIQSRLGLGKLAELKAGSSSGASGFGALSERELDLLVSNMGKLDQASDPLEIRRIITSISRQLDNASDRMRKKRGQAQDFYQKNKGQLPDAMQVPESPSAAPSNIYDQFGLEQ